LRGDSGTRKKQSEELKDDVIFELAGSIFFVTSLRINPVMQLNSIWPENGKIPHFLVLPQISDDDQTAVKIGLGVQSLTEPRTRAMFRGVKKTGPED
jgi:hypothetical protein